jgi:TRAP-type transport system small permease protein
MLERVERRIARGVELAAAGLLALMTLLVIVQVFFRYVLNDPLTWPEELARLSMIWLAFLASGVALWRRRHIRIEGFEGWLSPRLRLMLARTIDSLVAILLVVLVVQSLTLVLSTRNQHTAALQLPVSYAYYAAILVGTALMLFYQAMLMLRNRAGRADHAAEPSGRPR